MITITKKSKCCGCCACASSCPKQCISMVSDGEGFWYPQVQEADCIGCGLCEKVCPVLHDRGTDNAPMAYAAYHRDVEIRMESSSGGVFTLFAELVLRRGGVVFGARFDERFQVVHDYTETVEGLSRFRGSKYLQSRIGSAYNRAREFLMQGRTVLFSGTPCQIAGLRAFLGKEYDNLYCLDIICHGVPSPKVWERYLDQQEYRAASKAQSVSFRSKAEGWKRYCMTIAFENKEVYCRPFSEDAFMRAFLRDLCLRPSCYDCAFKKLNRESDATLADFWGIESVAPEMNDDKGTSLLIINSEKGKRMLESVAETLVLQPVELEKAISGNPAMLRSARPNAKRSAFFAGVESADFAELVELCCYENPVKKRLRRLVNTGKALLYTGAKALFRIAEKK